jgi:hypothetical protein
LTVANLAHVRMDAVELLGACLDWDHDEDPVAGAEGTALRPPATAEWRALLVDSNLAGLLASAIGTAHPGDESPVRAAQVISRLAGLAGPVLTQDPGTAGAGPAARGTQSTIAFLSAMLPAAADVVDVALRETDPQRGYVFK